MKFLDEATIVTTSGHGGAGAVSFRRDKYEPMGGPNGGDGGKGGDIIFIASHQLSTLIDFRYKRMYEAEDGGNGKSQNKRGKNGTDTKIFVPVGTIIKDEETGELLTDLKENGQVFVPLEGGKGGKGNRFFRSSTLQAPHFAQPGISGKTKTLSLELKLLADVGLIGFPNAGKSTLISKISNARPKIADYPFTTLVPNLGVVSISEMKSFVVADIPGIIEGAHTGVGLGVKFLKHVERTKILLHLIDVSEGDPIQKFNVLNNELKTYSSKLSQKEQTIVLTKIDLIRDMTQIEKISLRFKKMNLPVLSISAVRGTGIDSLLYAVSQKIIPDSSEQAAFTKAYSH